MTEESMVERVARAISPEWWTSLMPDGEHPLNNYPGQHVGYRERSLNLARAAILAIASLPYNDEELGTAIRGVGEAVK